MRRRAIAVLMILLLGGASLAYFGALRFPEFMVPRDSVGSRGAPAASPEAGLADALKRTPHGAGQQPKFDIARIDPDGVSVFAGRAEPNSVVTVFENGNPVGSVAADENGEWALSSEHKFTSADAKLTLEAKPAGAAVAAVTAGPGPAAPSSPKPEAGASGVATQRLMRNLEDMVAAARKEAAEQRPAAGPSPEAKSAHPDAGSFSPPPAAAPAPKQPSADGARLAAQAPREVRPAPPPATASAAGAAPSASIPIPITFVYREATFTDDGRRAAELLLEYLRLKKFQTVSPTGHADEIGGDIYNMALSEERLETVSGFLRGGGYAGKLDLVPKGKREPFAGVDRSRLPPDEVRQLDRRVELRVAN